MNSLSPNLNLMIKACEKASKSMIRDFGEIEKLQVSVKGPFDFVSNADLKVEKVLINELVKSKKNYSILSEEKGFINNKDKNSIWIIDPIDGTTNFLHGIPHFAISLALKIKNEIIAGVVYDPIKDEMFYAEKNNGAYLNNRRIRVSKKTDLRGCLFAYGGRLKNIDLNLRRTGSAALDIAYVACGRFDGYFQKNLNIWDVAAGVIILKEAGGLINESELDESSKFKIIASNNIVNTKMTNKLGNF